VGTLQFDVTANRLKQEYGADTVYESMDMAVARWVSCDDPKRLKEFQQENSAFLALDAEKELTFLGPSLWRLEHVMEQWPEVEFKKTREYN
jgi:peptide chain release factor 3